MGLLGGVDQQKKERKGARRYRALLDGKSVDLAQQIIEAGRPGLAVSPRSRGDTHLFDDLESLLSLESAYDATEGAGKPANIVM